MKKGVLADFDVSEVGADQIVSDVDGSASSAAVPGGLQPAGREPPTPLKEEKKEAIAELFWKMWNIKKPKLLLSMTGGCSTDDNDMVEDDLTLNSPVIKEQLKWGIVDTLKEIDCMIVTNGLNLGLTELVSDTVASYRKHGYSSHRPVTCLGILAKNYVEDMDPILEKFENKDELLRRFDLRREEYEKHLEKYQCIVEGKEAKKRLNFNHTNFLFVDQPDSSANQSIDHAIVTRALIEKEIMDTANAHVVMIVVQGGYPSLKRINCALEMGIPVLLLAGSGGVADLLSEILAPTFSLQIDIDLLKAKLGEPHNKGQQVDLKMMVNCLVNIKRKVQDASEAGKGKPIFSYQLSGDLTGDLGEAILLTILNSYEGAGDISKKIDLAFAWNKTDMAKEYIFTKEGMKALLKQSEEATNPGLPHQNERTLEYWLTEALVENKAGFVEVLMSSGIDLKKFLEQEVLECLYTIDQSQWNPLDSLGMLQSKHKIYQHEKQAARIDKANTEEERNNERLARIKRRLPKLWNELPIDHPVEAKDNLSLHEKRNGNASRQVSQQPAVEDHARPQKSSKSQENETIKKYELFEDDPKKCLFIWSVVANKPDIAVIFWRLCYNKVASALIAAKILRNLAELASSDQELDLNASLRKHSECFEERAIQVLTQSYNTNRVKGQELVKRKLTYWNTNLDLIDLAHSFESTDFIKHDSCQKILNNRWYGNLAPSTPSWRIFVCIISFGLPILRSKEFIDVNAEPDREPSCFNGVSSSTDDDTIDPGRITRLSNFFTAPLVKFSYHTISQIIFTLGLSFFIMFELEPKSFPCWMEWTIWCWTVAFLLEEVVQFFKCKRGKLGPSAYYKNFWNIIDILLIVFMVLSGILHFLLPLEYFVGVRTLYALVVLLAYFRFLQVFFAFKEIGPKLIMIRRMLVDLTEFIFILLVFLLSFAVVSQALRYPTYFSHFHTFMDTFIMPYWQIYGETFLEDFHGHVSGCTDNVTMVTDTVPLCPQTNYLLYVLLILYMIFTNILLLNLVIAMFATTFNEVEKNSYGLWCLHRVELIEEYKLRSRAPAPLNLVTIPAVGLYKKLKSYSSHAMAEAEPEEDWEMDDFEQSAMERVLYDEYVRNQEAISSKVENASKRIQRVMKDLEFLKMDVSILRCYPHTGKHK